LSPTAGYQTTTKGLNTAILLLQQLCRRFVIKLLRSKEEVSANACFHGWILSSLRRFLRAMHPNFRHACRQPPRGALSTENLALHAAALQPLDI